VLLLLGLILPLGLDTFAVAAALGAVGVGGRRRLRLSLLFACFEGGMPLIGLVLGAAIGQAIGDIGSYVASGALILLGGYLLVASEEGEERRVAQLARSRGLVLLSAGLAVSLDELAIGLAFGLLSVPIVPALAAIAIQAFVISQLGFHLGGRVHERIREGTERLAGIVLMVLGLFLVAAKVLGVSP
jgi:putative Mn2+ efflux pump MntP